MVEQEEIWDPRTESLTDKISDRIHGDDGGDTSSSSSDSDPDDKKTTPESSVRDRFCRLFSREKPLHKVFGGGKAADVILWRKKTISASVLGGATAVWVLFELQEYHLLTLVSHVAILVISLSFLWSNASVFIHKRTPRIPEVGLPQEPFLEVASALGSGINYAFAQLREISSGKDLKKFLGVVAGLWFISIVGSCCNFLTLLYILCVLLHTVPVLFEKYDDKIDAIAEKAMHEIEKRYAVFDHKILSKIPWGPLKKKRA